jgi:hypothetical protein
MGYAVLERYWGAKSKKHEMSSTKKRREKNVLIQVAMAKAGLFF